jgi:hypothetical protein
LRKNAGNAVRMLFGDEIIQTRISFAEQCIEGSLSPVLGVKMERRAVLSA